MKNKIIGLILLAITAFFWGITFVFQRIGSDYIGPYTWNATRYLISGIIMLSFYFILKKTNKNNLEKQKTLSKKRIIIYTILVGVFLCLGSNFQQIGITLTKSASKIGFLTSTYIVFVPLISFIFLKKKVSPIILGCLATAMVGFYLISIKGKVELEFGDIITIFSSVSFALQIIFIGLVNDNISGILLSGIQFMITFILSFILMVIFEGIDFKGVLKALPAICFAAIFSGCVAYTLQIYGQKYTDDTVASLIMSFESVFSLIFSMVILKEVLLPREWIGSALIFVSIIVSQIGFKKIGKKKYETS